MKIFQKFLVVGLTLSFLFALSLFASAAPLKLKTAWMDEHETFLAWYAKEKGWDKEEGLDLDLLYFDSGMAILSALPAGEWVIAGMGAVPATMGHLRYDTYVIGNGNDESMTNAILIRPDSPIFSVKGYNKEYPEVYGSPETVKGQEFLVTSVSSASFTFTRWLEVLGLTEKDVVVKYMDQAQAFGAFNTKIGDGVALWAPLMFSGIDKGWKVAATPKTLGIGNPIVFIAEKKFADNNPEVLAKFLRVYLRSVDMMQNEPIETIIPEYQRFFLEWAGKEYDSETARRDILSHPVFNLKQQLELFDSSKGISTAQKWQADIARLFKAAGNISEEEFNKVGSGKFATDKFLKLVKAPIPSYK